MLRRRRNLISRIYNSNGKYIFDLPRIKEVFLNHFKYRWFHSDNIGIIEYPFIQSKFSPSQNEKLIKPISYIEIDKALQSLHLDKVLGSDGSPPFFF